MLTSSQSLLLLPFSMFKHSWWIPEVEILEKKSLYKAIFIDWQEEQTWLYSAYTGKKALTKSSFFDKRTS